MLHAVQLDDNSPAAHLKLSMGAHGHVRVDTSNGQFYLAQWLMGLPETRVTHRDGNIYNCQRHNLKIDDIANTSRFAARLVLANGQRVCLGTYETAVLAAQAYEKACLQIYSNVNTH